MSHVNECHETGIFKVKDLRNVNHTNHRIFSDQVLVPYFNFKHLHMRVRVRASACVCERERAHGCAQVFLVCVGQLCPHLKRKKEIKKK